MRIVRLELTTAEAINAMATVASINQAQSKC
jgi:hypothetical protein